MKANLPVSLNYLFVSEGGYGNVKGDRGGPTNKGVIQAEYNSFRRLKHLPTQSVRNITTEEAVEIYRTKYWSKVQGDDLPSGLDYAVFDFAVNSGPHEAVVVLQRTINELHDKALKVDGILGVITLDFLKDIDPETLIRAYIKKRYSFMQGLRSLWRIFGKGWKNRLFGQAGDPGVLANALTLLGKKEQ